MATAGADPAPDRGRPPLLRLLALARPLRGRLAAAVLCGVGSAACAVALLATSGFLLARASQRPGIVAISVAVTAVRGLSIGRALLRYLDRLGSHDVAFRVLADIRVAIYRRLERLAPAGLAGYRSGDLLARLVSDVDATQDLFLRGLAPPLTALLVGAGAVLAALAILPTAALLLAVGLVTAGIAVPWISARAASWASASTAQARGELADRLADALAGAAELRACGAAEQAAAQVTDADRRLTRLASRAAAAAGLGTGLSALVAGLTMWSVLTVGVAATSVGELGRVTLAVVTLIALATFDTVSGLPAAAIQLGQSATSAGRITAVLDAADPVAEPASPAGRPAAPVRVELKAAQVRYRQAGPLALRGIDLLLEPGRRVALVGPAGAGKSTVAAVLLRFTGLCGGTALLNGQDLAGFSGDDVRGVVCGLTQDAHIFDSTIRANLLIGRPAATDAELEAVAGQVRLAGWIGSLPLGWQTPVGRHGARLSGGQRQRLALARALLADPAVLILDEPTAHLDPVTRSELAADLLAITSGRSTLLITHDLAGLDQVDEIVVLDHGLVAERGSHQQLSRSGGLYQRMLAAASY